MALSIEPNTKLTFTIKSAPRRPAERKTIQRLMRMQPDIRRGLSMLQAKRAKTDNREYIRAGVWWNDRVKATRLTKVEPGQSFTLHITPQIIPDLKSVEKYLDAKSA